MCGSEFEVLKVKDLYGNEAPVGKNARHAEFKMDRKNLMPRRYVF